MDKLDYKKVYKDLYLPGTTPVDIVIPAMPFIMIDGKGDPNAHDGAYAKAVGVLYTLAYAIKMSKLDNHAPERYFEYVVPPLEGLWWYDDGGPFRFGGKSHFCWTMMIRQPDFVSQELFERVISKVSRKNPDVDLTGVRLCDFEEGLCVQCMHIGPYDDEPRTVEKMEAFMHTNGFVLDFSDTRRHHEIYLGDPRKAAPATLKTVIRHPVRRF